MSIDQTIALDGFQSVYGRGGTVVARAPGRVNIIGEHTDYNHGFVLPMAIDRDTVLVAAPRDDRTIAVYSKNLDCHASVDLRNPTRNESEPWVDYIAGVAHMLQESGRTLSGADVYVMGDVPLGSGLSSSASLEVAVVSMFEALSNFTVPDKEAAEICLRVENEFLGVQSGIMDQFTSRSAQAGHALFLDCRSLEVEQIPSNFAGAQFVIAHTGKSRALTESKYNDRVRECAGAVTQLNAALQTSYTHLRDFDVEQLATGQAHMGEVESRRAWHVVSENDRCRQACEALRDGDLEMLGALMNASHESLEADYAVSCPELNTMTGIARRLKGCYGSRMTGAGFGGCTISLVARLHVQAFATILKMKYDAETERRSEIIVSSPVTGSTIVRL